MTISGLANGVYNYVFTNAVGGSITVDYSPQGGNYAQYNGSFTINAGPAVVPLPAGGILLLTAMGALTIRSRRKS